MKGYIYKIYDNTNGNVYYGSTKEKVSSRIAKHRYDHKKYLEGKNHYVRSFDILKNNDYSYSVIEEIDYENKWELHNKERFYIENNDCINKYIPNRTQKEWREDNKEIIAEKNKEWREDNKEIIAEKNKEWREDNKETIKEYNKQYNQDNKEIIKDKKKKIYEKNKEIILQKQKEYNEKNKEIILQKQKEYNEKNKEIIKQKKNEKITCECGCEVSRTNLPRHRKTKNHLLFLETLQ
jgi:post-segregation antitoxin (ccd killing protein)